MKTTVDRQKWLRGNPETSVLRNTNRRMCCLGFRAVEGGALKKNLVGIFSPYGYIAGGAKGNVFPRSLFTSNGYNSPQCRKLMHINDRRDIDDCERESKLKKLFESMDEEIEFIN